MGPRLVGRDLPMTVSIDGGGVFPDSPLPAETRLRIGTGNPREDVSVFVEGNRIHVIGQYGRVVAERLAPNHIELFTIVPAVAETEEAA